MNDEKAQLLNQANNIKKEIKKLQNRFWLLAFVNLPIAFAILNSILSFDFSKDFKLIFASTWHWYHKLIFLVIVLIPFALLAILLFKNDANIKVFDASKKNLKIYGDGDEFEDQIYTVVKKFHAIKSNLSHYVLFNYAIIFLFIIYLSCLFLFK